MTAKDEHRRPSASPRAFSSKSPKTATAPSFDYKRPATRAGGEPYHHSSSSNGSNGSTSSSTSSSTVASASTSSTTLSTVQQQQPHRQQPSQTKFLMHSLPPSTICSFVRDIFTEDLSLVDFTHALTALDYLKVLDDRRKLELAAVLRRLNVDAAVFEQDRRGLQSRFPGIIEWMASMEDKSKKIEALYTQVYIGLRRWTLINEMRLEPFNKANCIVMLDALYPPSYGTPPTSQLTDIILNYQRNSFFRYVQAVERHGKSILHNLESASRRPGDLNGWPVVRDIVDVYMTKVTAIIDECRAIRDAEAFAMVAGPQRRAESEPSVLGRPSTPADMRRPSTSLGPHPSTRSLPQIPATPMTPPPLKKSHSTFESIAHRLRRVKSRSADSTDRKSGEDDRTGRSGSVFPGFFSSSSSSSSTSQNSSAAGSNSSSQATTPAAELPGRRSLRKMKSAGVLRSSSDGHRKDNHGRSTSSDSAGIGRHQSADSHHSGGSKHSRGNSSERNPLLDHEIDDAERARLIREAQRDKENRRQPKRVATGCNTSISAAASAHRARYQIAPPPPPTSASASVPASCRTPARPDNAADSYFPAFPDEPFSLPHTAPSSPLPHQGLPIAELQG